jgi:protoporphyrinogen/coproporphyrinogen III oxidase
MAIKKIAIIGGGISGLAVLHYLKKRLGNDASLTLYERNEYPGGNIQSLEENGFLFETGPNGFISRPETLSFIDELGLKNQLIESASKSARRYVKFNNRLMVLPDKPLKFIGSNLMSFTGKWKFVSGIFNKNVSKDQSIHNYAVERFGREAAERLFDPFVSGIYAGDTTRLHMGSCFPKAFKGGRLMTLRAGMGQIIERLEERYNSHIKVSSEITDINQIEADRMICAVPAYAAARILNIDVLDEVPYAPVAVVGMGFKLDAFTRLPDGFGYVVPSKQSNDVLGVLFESNVFDYRAPRGMIMVRVMMGGCHHPLIINDDKETLLAKALKELDSTYGLKSTPMQTWVKMWPKAIPQYEMGYPQLVEKIKTSSSSIGRLSLCGNYLGGISFNDCVNNAKSIAPFVAL